MKKIHVPLWLKGVLLGEAFWSLALLGAYIFETFETGFPQWFLALDLADTLGSICGIITAPVSLGGWLFIWGDNGPPYPWIGSIIFNIGFGVSFYGLLGGLGAVLLAKFRK